SAPIIDGVFHSRQSGRVVQLFGQNGQQYVSIGGADYPVTMDERGTLRPSSPMDFLDWAVTVIGGSPNVEGIDLSEFGQTDQLIAVTAPQSSHEGLIVGRYRSESTGTAITISCLDNRFELSATG